MSVRRPSASRGPTTTSRGLGTNRQDVQRLAGGEAQSLALADREAMHAAVRPDDCAVAADERAGSLQLGRRALDERGIVAVRDEADLLAVRLGRDAELESPRVLADCLLVEMADREPGARQLLLREREQEVGLILGRVERRAAARRCRPSRARCARSARWRGHRRQIRAPARAASKTSGRHCSARTESACGRAVLADEVRHHLLVEAALEVHDVVRDADGRRDAPRVVEIVNRAAGAEAALTRRGL